MIGRLTGRLAQKSDDHVLIDVNGVGYVVYVSERTLLELPGLGEIVALYTELLVREDLLQLFGFQTTSERAWHRLLTSVQGIGAKASMALLGTLGAEGIGRAIALGDVAAVKSAPGIGPKIAARLVNELKDKAPLLMAQAEAPVAQASTSSPVLEQPAAAPVAPAQPLQASGQAEALSALANLGYVPADAARAVAQAADAGAEGTPSLIKGALKLLAPGG